jgi:WD40 repeat protein
MTRTHILHLALTCRLCDRLLAANCYISLELKHFVWQTARLVWPVHCNLMVNCMQFGMHLVINSLHFAAAAWSPRHHGLLASGGGTADHCIRFWNTRVSEVQRVDTGSQVSNLAWARDSSEPVSFLHTKTVLSLATEMVF